MRPSQRAAAKAPLPPPTPWKRRRTAGGVTQVLGRDALAAAVRVWHLLVAAVIAFGRLLVWAAVAAGRLLSHAAATLPGAVRAVGGWVRPRADALGSAATGSVRERVAAVAETIGEFSFPAWDLPSALPAAGSPLIPLGILLAAVLIAATLGGVLAAALS